MTNMTPLQNPQKLRGLHSPQKDIKENIHEHAVLWDPTLGLDGSTYGQPWLGAGAFGPRASDQGQSLLAIHLMKSYGKTVLIHLAIFWNRWYVLLSCLYKLDTCSHSFATAATVVFERLCSLTPNYESCKVSQMPVDHSGKLQWFGTQWSQQVSTL